MTHARCRFCDTPLVRVFCDLGMSPLSNAFLTAEQLDGPEPLYPLKAYVCDGCFLVQLQQYETPENIFSDYAYFSSYSETWLEHARAFAANMIGRFDLTPSSRVVEIASNDGYLLQYFKQAGIPVLGIEPATNVARMAEERGIPTLVRFFGAPLATELARQGASADLLVGNNVLAHVPNLNDFVAGLKLVLKPNGIITMEFPHLLRLVSENQFDTIYHEHFSYFSLRTVERIFAHHGLAIFDVDELPTHGGSLRIYARHAGARHSPGARLVQVRAAEQAAGLDRSETYTSFAVRVQEVKRALLEFLIGAKRHGESIVAYGAAAKGNTLLNYCGIREDFIDYVADRNPYKQGKYLPGTHIPVCAPDRIRETRPDLVLILPWNLKDEITQQLNYIRAWGGRFVTAIPSVAVTP